MTLKRSLIGGACLSLQPLLLNALSVPAMAYIIRSLGPTAFGQWMMATSLIAALAVLSSLGLRGAFIRHVAANPDDAAAALADQLGVRLTLSAIVAMLAMTLCAALGYSTTVTTCVAVSAIGLLITTVASTLVDLLHALHRSTTVAAANLVAGVLLTAASVLAAWHSPTPAMIALAYLTGPAMATAALWLVVRRLMPVRVCFDCKATWTMVKRCRAFTAQQLLNTAPAYVEAIVLPRLIGTAGFGFFAAGTLLPARLTAVPDGLCTAAYPLLTRRFTQSTDLGTRLTLQCLATVVALCAILAVTIALLATPIAALLFPTDPALCRVVLLITIWALPLMAAETVLGYAINAAGHDAAQARVSLPTAVCNVVLTLLLIVQLGLVGACIAMPLRHLVRIIMLGACFVRSTRVTSAAEPASPALARAA